MELKPFDPDASCPKCGHRVVGIAYCRHPKVFSDCDHLIHYGARIGEHMHRTCKQCGYVWFELPLDSIE